MWQNNYCEVNERMTEQQLNPTNQTNNQLNNTNNQLNNTNNQSSQTNRKVDAVELEKEFDLLIEKIKSSELRLLEFVYKIEDNKLEMKKIELAMQSSILTAVNPATGKPLFSNEMLREAELFKRKNEDIKYQIMLKEYNLLRKEQVELMIELDSLKNKLTTLKAICYHNLALF